MRQYSECMDELLDALGALCSAATDTPETAVIVVVDHPTMGRGGFVHIPVGSEDHMAVLGSLGVVALKGTGVQQRELFDAIGMFLLSPEAAQA